MRERISTAWELFVVSCRTLLSHPRLLLFPVTGVSGLALSMGLFVVTVTVPRWLDKDVADAIPFPVLFTGMMLGFLLPWLGYLLAGLSYAGFYHEAVRALSGEPVSILRGLRAALTRIRALIFWALFAVIIGKVLGLLGKSFGLGSAVAAAATGFGWAVASFFVIPIIMREPKQPADPAVLLRKSVGLVRQTWGESVTGTVGTSILSLPLFLFPIGWMISRSGIDFPGMGLVFALVAVPVILWQLAVMLCSEMYRCALYVYATEGVVPEPFDARQMESAWKVRRGAAVRANPPAR